MFLRFILISVAGRNHKNRSGERSGSFVLLITRQTLLTQADFKTLTWIRITWRACSNAECFPSPEWTPNSVALGDAPEAALRQVPGCCWCCWSGDYTFRPISSELWFWASVASQNHLGSLNFFFFLNKTYLASPQTYKSIPRVCLYFKKSNSEE